MIIKNIISLITLIIDYHVWENGKMDDDSQESLMKAHKWGSKETDKFVLKAAKKKGYKGNNLSGAIEFLEEYAPIWTDKTTNDFGGGYQHHLRNFSHHPTLIGIESFIMMII